jgi:thiamine transport system substrate-binding protein
MKRALLLEDPRTSTPGLAFVLFVDAVKRRGASVFFEKLPPQWVTLAAGWDQAYGLFLKQEAPLVWSYTTSQAFHRAHGDREDRYRALIPDEGAPIQIEGAFIVAGNHQTDASRELSRKLLEYLMSPSAQAKIPTTQWMWPARENTPLPDSFRRLPIPKREIRLTPDANAQTAILANWAEAIRKGGASR